MNWITKLLRRKEIKQCAILGVSIRFSRRQYDKRRIPELYFTKNYTIKNSVLCIKGDEYSPYMWNYDRMIGLIKDGILSENVC
jgi:hypothetical protein